MIELLIDGVRFGLVVALAATGLSLIFSTTKIVNFAYGELISAGAMTAFFLNASRAGPGWALLPAILMTIPISSGYGWVLDRGFFRPLQKAGIRPVGLMVASVGLALVLRYTILGIFGPDTRPLRGFNIPPSWVLGSIRIDLLTILTIVIIGSLLTAFVVVVRRTSVGQQIRGVADSPDLAAASGVDVSKVNSRVWMVGVAMAGLAGVFQALSSQVTWTMGLNLILLVFASVILGGLGVLGGAIAGGLALGVASQVSTLWLPVELKVAIAMIAMVLVLVFKPEGLFRVARRVA